MTCSVVIPTWDSRDLLERCLASLWAADPALDVVVVDNGSVDGTAAWLVDGAPGTPRVVSYAVNQGFAIAMNAGVRAATGELVLLLNVDCVVAPGAIAALVAELEADAGLAAVQPLIIQTDTEPPLVYSAGQVLLRDGRALEEGGGRPATEAPAGSVDIFGVCGAACLFRRATFLALGGFEERFFAFHEDVELNLRARLLGWRFRLVPRARVEHVGNAVWARSLARPSAFNARLVARNRLATTIKLLPMRCWPAALVAELGSVALAIRRGTGVAVLAGKVEALSWAPRLLRERRAARPGRHRARVAPWLRPAGASRLRPITTAPLAARSSGQPADAHAR